MAVLCSFSLGASALGLVVEQVEEEFRGKIWYQNLPLKRKAPNSKLQAPEKHHRPKPQGDSKFRISDYGARHFAAVEHDRHR
jgi:hypothetical protein